MEIVRRAKPEEIDACYASGVYQLGLGDISSLVEFNAQKQGTPVVQAVYQYYNRAPFAIIGRKDRGVTADFKSLAGKKVAAAAVESTRRAWPLVARKQGMRADAFQWQTTDFSARDSSGRSTMATAMPTTPSGSW